MSLAAEVLSWSDEPFKYIGGDPSLDLVNTVDWTAHGLENDRLTDYDRLVSWAEGAGTLSPRHAAALRAAAPRGHIGEAGDRVADAAVGEGSRTEGDGIDRAGAIGERRWSPRVALETAKSLRSALQRVFSVVARTGQVPQGDVLAELNRHVTEALCRQQLTRRGGGERVARWYWVGEGVVLESMLWPVARSAGVLLTSEEARSIRICSGDACGWMFVDRSRNRLRRWCEMQTCGTRAKSRRRAERRLVIQREGLRRR